MPLPASSPSHSGGVSTISKQYFCSAVGATGRAVHHSRCITNDCPYTWTMNSKSIFICCHQRQSRHQTRQSAGFSLLEVLISIIILSFGLLGMVGLQAAALQGSRDARLQSVATTMARELTDMMRGNQAVANRSSSDALTNPYIGRFSNPDGTTALAPATKSYCLAVGGTCSSTTTSAQSQMTDWLTRLDAELPGARVEVCPDAAPFDTKGVAQWTACPSAVANSTIFIKIGWTRVSTNRSNSGAAALDNASSPSVVVQVSPGNQ